MGLLALMATFGVAAQGAYIRALAVAEASELAPYGFLRLLFAALAGFLFFSEVPDFWTVVGGTVIVASTLYIARREAVLGKDKPAIPAS
jgi:drug/metabolite transporter (DMT)-like permease